jgi:hypothetical protein
MTAAASSVAHQQHFAQQFWFLGKILADWPQKNVIKVHTGDGLVLGFDQAPETDARG